MVTRPRDAAVSAARFWRHKQLNERSVQELNYNSFYSVVGRVNAAHLEVGERWAAYQRALDVLGGRKKK